MIHFPYSRIICMVALACLAAPVKAAPTPVITGNIVPRASNSSDFLKQNGLAALKLNLEFAFLQQSDNCTEGETGCISGSFAQCVGSQWQTNACPAGTSCFALPLVNSVGTSIVCDSQADALARIQATGVSITGQDDSNSTTTSSASGSLASGNSNIPSGTGTAAIVNDSGIDPSNFTSTSSAVTPAGDESAATFSQTTNSPTFIILTSQAVNTASSSITSSSPAISPIVLPTPTNAVLSTSTAVSSTPPVQSTLPPFATAAAISAPASVGSSTFTGADGEVTVIVTVTATGTCTDSATDSALAFGASSTPSIFTSSAPTSLPATSVISSPTSTLTSTSATLTGFEPFPTLDSTSGDSPLISSSNAFSIGSAVTAAVSVSVTPSSTTSSSAFQFAVPTLVATTTSNTVNNPVNSAAVASMLTATI